MQIHKALGNEAEIGRICIQSWCLPYKAFGLQRELRSEEKCAVVIQHVLIHLTEEVMIGHDWIMRFIMAFQLNLSHMKTEPHRTAVIFGTADSRRMNAIREFDRLCIAVQTEHIFRQNEIVIRHRVSPLCDRTMPL